MIRRMQESRSSASDAAPRTAACLFDAVLQPHTSLGRQGFLLLMSAVCAVCFVGGAVFLVAGAWPVTGFFGLDAALIYVAFRANYRWARTRETLRLTEDALVVERVDPAGKVERWRFQPGWLRIDAPNDGSLVLSSHGRRLTIGAFLTPDERTDLARALGEALARCRLPVHLR